MQRQMMARRYVWLVLVLVLLALGATCCKGVALHQNNERSTAAPRIKVNVTEGWAELTRQVRDVQVLEGSLLLSNSAPPMGQGPGDGKPFIAAFDLNTQEIVWEVGYTSTVPIVANTRNLYVVRNSQLVAVDLEDGNEVWSVPFTDSGLSQMSCGDDLVLAANKESLFAFDATTGELRWESNLPLSLDPFVPLVTSFISWREYSALTMHDRMVYVRRLDYHDPDECRFSLFALDTDGGRERWRFPIQQANRGECLPGTFPLVFGDGLVLVETWDGLSGNCVLNTLDEGSGKIVWRHSVSGGCSAHSYFLDGKFVRISAQNMVALEAQSGRVLWQREIPPGVPQLIADRGWIVLWPGGNAERTLSLIDLRSGKLLSEMKVTTPETCHSASSVVGFSDERGVLVVGNCIRSFGISENGRLEP